jgi:hypothetical protein
LSLDKFPQQMGMTHHLGSQQLLFLATTLCSDSKAIMLVAATKYNSGQQLLQIQELTQVLILSPLASCIGVSKNVNARLATPFSRFPRCYAMMYAQMGHTLIPFLIFVHFATIVV